MKKFILFIALLLPVMALVAQMDSAAYQGKAGIADVADEDPGLFMFMMIFLLGLIVAIIVSLIGASLLALFIFLLTAAGILSASVFMAWYKKSFYTGLKWFVYLSFSIAGMVGVSLVCLLLCRFGDIGYTLKTLVSWGVPAGLAGGLLAGWLVLTISRVVYRYFLGKMKLKGITDQ